MEKELLQLKKLLKHHRRMHRIYKECNHKTFCNGSAAMQEGYNVSRLEEFENVKALQLAIRIIKRAQAEKLKN